VSLAFAERRPSRRLLAALHGVLLLALLTIVGSDQAFLFLLAWETLTLTLYLITAADRRPDALLAAYFTGSMSKLGGAALLAAFGLLYGQTGSFHFSAWAAAAPDLDGGVRTAVFLLLLIGFGSKLGTLLFQGPLPLAYAAAAGPAAASLSIALNAGFYGLWRLVFATLGPAELWWGELVLMVGGVGAIIGVLYAINQDELRRFLGLSSVEHAGIVLIGFGAALIGQASGERNLAAAGLLAATLHIIAHGVGKTLAFLAVDRVETSTDERALEPLGGLGRLLPRTGLALGLATLTLAAMPPLGGFVSEWFTFMSLLQGFRLGNTDGRLFMALAAAMLALTSGLGLLAFAKFFGTSFLGRARHALARVREAGLGLGMITLAAAAAVLGPIAPWEIRWLGKGLLDALGFDAGPYVISHPLVLGPVYPHFSVLAPTWLTLALGAFALVAFVAIRAARGSNVRTAPVWVSGTAVDPALFQYTPAAYINPIRVVLRGLYGFRRQLHAEEGDRHPAAASLVLETRVVPPFEHYIYRPVVTGTLALVTEVRRLQSGRLGVYLIYMLVIVLVVLGLIPVLK
jgi:hydrogenase-4 component B